MTSTHPRSPRRSIGRQGRCLTSDAAPLNRAAEVHLPVVDWMMTSTRLHDDQTRDRSSTWFAASSTPSFLSGPMPGSVPLTSSGTVNALYRLGGDLLVRLPLAIWGAEAVEREQEWLPRLSPLLPVEIPRLLGRGQPGLGYPCPWSVFDWIEGSHPQPDRLPTSDGLADDLASLIRAFHEIDLPDAPEAYRGPVSEVDRSVRRCIAELADEFDPGRPDKSVGDLGPCSRMGGTATVGPQRPAREQPPDS